VAEGPSTLVWELSFLPHTQYENIKTKLTITAMSELQVFACVSSQEDMRIWRYIYSFDVNELSKEKSKLVDMVSVSIET